MRLKAAVTLGELARVAGAAVSGDAAFEVQGLASLERAGDDELSFARAPSFRDRALASRAGALLVPEDFGELDRPGLVAADVDRALAVAGEFLSARECPPPEAGVHQTAILGEGVEIGEGASVGPYAVLEPGVSVGERTHIGAGAYLGRGATVGADTVIHPHATVCWGCRVGERCVVHGGAVIGADGFGFATNPDGSYRKIPQLGNVILEDDVEIGACTTIDRATIDSTVIARGAKLDNLIHIAHNCFVGEGTAMAAQVGVAGSTKIGARCQFGGQAGITGHVELGDDVRVGAATPVIKSIPDGMVVWGYPAREKSRAVREMAGAARSWKLVEEVRALRKRVRALEAGTGPAAPSEDS
ncbi:MAG: UDP-3-O-(3-hydroxymyristoyl)glucosamine N-acyltransferase [Planctomycetota bacterium]